jgi:gluconate 2-dehydrogenase gamma chain
MDCIHGEGRRISSDTRLMNSTRRDWIFGSLGSAAYAAIVSAQDHAHAVMARGGNGDFEYFDPATATDIAAIAAQILPSDDGPGAKEAGVIFFIDRALTTFDADKQDIYRRGMAEIESIRKKTFPTSTSIAALSSEQQLELLHSIEHSEFFEIVRIHTLLGFLGNPSYGGNRGKVGWKYIGFEDRMEFQPPFGYYDTQAKNERS